MGKMIIVTIFLFLYNKSNNLIEPKKNPVKEKIKLFAIGLIECDTGWLYFVKNFLLYPLKL